MSSQTGPQVWIFPFPFISDARKHRVAGGKNSYSHCKLSVSGGKITYFSLKPLQIVRAKRHSLYCMRVTKRFHLIILQTMLVSNARCENSLAASFCWVYNERLTMLQKSSIFVLFKQLQSTLSWKFHAVFEKLESAHALINVLNEYLFVSVFFVFVFTISTRLVYVIKEI